MQFAIPPGVFDILPNESQEKWRRSDLWSYLETKIRQTAADYGFQEIRTPVFERTELFKRGVGETSDIVSKEMYTFLDKGERSMSLRPEGTAPAMRAFIENQMHQANTIHKLYYIGPMFRYERAQAGRYRQHHQFGAEVIGIKAPEQDVEIIDLLYTLYNRLGIKNLQVNVNSIGDVECRLKYKQALVDYLKKFHSDLSKESKTRLEVNPMRILDSKDPKDKEITAHAPSILNFLDDECREHFEIVQKELRLLNIPFKISHTLVRGLDYYNKTVFEIVAGELGAQNSVAGGGRYDGLLKTLGGPDLPATGFATGMERVIQTMLKQAVPMPPPFTPEVFLIALGDAAKQACFSLLHALRQRGISSQMDFSGRKVNKLMQYANQIQATYVIIMGDNELQSGEIELKEMASGEKYKIPIEHLAEIMSIEKQNVQCFDLLNTLSAPFSHQAQADFFLKKISKTIDQTAQVAENLKSAMESIQKLQNEKTRSS